LADVTLAELRELWRENAQRFADLLNQGFRDPNVEKVSLRMAITGAYATEDGDNLTQFKATADDGVLRIDSPKYTAFIHVGERNIESVVLAYRQKRTGQYL
jgi:hypothetical protein